MVTGCEWPCCDREAEVRVVMVADPGVDPILACGLHVTPVLVAAAEDDPMVFLLDNRPESSASAA